MNVHILSPFSARSNPYLTLLLHSLRNKDINAECIINSGILPLWAAAQDLELPGIIHIQWHHRYFRASTLPRAMIRTALFFAQWILLRMRGIRFAWTVHNILSHEKQQSGWELFACRLLAKAADVLLVHCPEARKLVGETYHVPREKIFVAPHGNYKDWYPEPISRVAARAQLDLTSKARVFLYFGQIRSYKGVESLLDAFDRLDMDQAHLIVLGQARSDSLLQTLIQRAAADERIKLHGKFASEEELVTYISAADAVVLPYREVLTSGAAVLAMSYARPVVVPNLGCFRDLPEEVVIRFDPGDPDGLRRALSDCASLPLDQIGQEALCFAEKMTWGRTAGATIQAYQAGVEGLGHGTLRNDFGPHGD